MRSVTTWATIAAIFAAVGLVLQLIAAVARHSGPQVGTERGACYGNGTCNAGLTCASRVCVRLPAPDAGLNGERP